jgi:hypothetical protein
LGAHSNVQSAAFLNPLREFGSASKIWEGCEHIHQHNAIYDTKHIQYDKTGIFILTTYSRYHRNISTVLPTKKLTISASRGSQTFRTDSEISFDVMKVSAPNGLRTAQEKYVSSTPIYYHVHRNIMTSSPMSCISELFMGRVDPTELSSNEIRNNPREQQLRSQKGQDLRKEKAITASRQSST